MKSISFIYTCKIWLTTVFIAPLIQCAIFHFKEPLDGLLGLWFFYAVVFGGGLSAPSVILYWMAIWSFTRTSIRTVIVKLYLSLVGIVLTLGAFILSYGLNFFKVDIVVSVPYVIVTTASVWFYKFPQSHHQLDQKNCPTCQRPPTTCHDRN